MQWKFKRRITQTKRIKRKKNQMFYEEKLIYIYHISDAVIEPYDKGEEDEEEGDCVLVRHCKACKPRN